MVHGGYGSQQLGGYQGSRPRRDSTGLQQEMRSHVDRGNNPPRNSRPSSGHHLDSYVTVPGQTRNNAMTQPSGPESRTGGSRTTAVLPSSEGALSERILEVEHCTDSISIHDDVASDVHSLDGGGPGDDQPPPPHVGAKVSILPLHHSRTAAGSGGGEFNDTGHRLESAGSAVQPLDLAASSASISVDAQHRPNWKHQEVAKDGPPPYRSVDLSNFESSQFLLDI